MVKFTHEIDSCEGVRRIQWDAWSRHLAADFCFVVTLDAGFVLQCSLEYRDVTPECNIIYRLG